MIELSLNTKVRSDRIWVLLHFIEYLQLCIISLKIIVRSSIQQLNEELIMVLKLPCTKNEKIHN